MKVGDRFSYHQLWWLSMNYYLCSHKKNNTFLFSSFTKLNFEQLFFSLRKTFSHDVSWQAGWRVHQAEKSQKNEGLLTNDGEMTTGLVVIVAESCSWLPDNETNYFTVRFASCLSADERRHSPGCLRLLCCNNVWRSLPATMCQISLRLRTALPWNIQNLALCGGLAHIRPSCFKERLVPKHLMN